MTEVLTALREIIGVEAYGHLLKAAKITGKDVVSTAQEALQAHSRLVDCEQQGWAVQLVRGDDLRPFSIEID